TRYATDIFASTMKTNELSSIRTSYSLSNPPGSSHLAEARPATSSNYSRRHATGIGRVLSQPMERGGVRTVTSWLILDPQIGRTLSFCTSNADGAAAHSSRQHPTRRANNGATCAQITSHLSLVDLTLVRFCFWPGVSFPKRSSEPAPALNL